VCFASSGGVKSMARLCDNQSFSVLIPEVSYLNPELQGSTRCPTPAMMRARAL
jgi:hypothetical protein